MPKQRKAGSVIRQPRPQPKAGRRSGFSSQKNNDIPSRFLDAANLGVQSLLRTLALTQDPSVANDVTNAMKKSKADGSGYQPSGGSSLTPDNLLRFRQFLLSPNTLWGLMIYTMILIGSKLFQRADETISLLFDSLESACRF